jgi:hypothetical protein
MIQDAVVLQPPAQMTGQRGLGRRQGSKTRPPLEFLRLERVSGHIRPRAHQLPALPSSEAGRSQRSSSTPLRASPQLPQRPPPHRAQIARFDPRRAGEVASRNGGSACCRQSDCDEGLLLQPHPLPHALRSPGAADVCVCARVSVWVGGRLSECVSE